MCCINSAQSHHQLLADAPTIFIGAGPVGAVAGGTGCDDHAGLRRLLMSPPYEVQATVDANATALMAAVASSMPGRPPRASPNSMLSTILGDSIWSKRNSRLHQRADDRQRDALVNILSGGEGQ